MGIDQLLDGIRERFAKVANDAIAEDVTTLVTNLVVDLIEKSPPALATLEAGLSTADHAVAAFDKVEAALRAKLGVVVADQAPDRGTAAAVTTTTDAAARAPAADQSAELDAANAEIAQLKAQLAAQTAASGAGTAATTTGAPAGS